MKKLLTVITVVTMLASCKKEAIDTPLNEGTHAVVRNEQVTDTSGSFTMDWSEFNCVTKENVSIHGVFSYTYKVTDTKISYSQVISMTGIGETSGNSYTGRSREVSTQTISNEQATGGTGYRSFIMTNNDTGVRSVYTYSSKYTIDAQGYYHLIFEKIVDPC